MPRLRDRVAHSAGGRRSFFVILLTGQIISAMVISHFGWLGSPVNPLDIMKVSGAALMILGAYLTTR